MTVSPLENRLLEEWQRDLPIVPRPFAVMADRMDATEANVIGCLKGLQAKGAISRVGGVVRPNTLGASTLAAMAVPDLEANSVADVLVREPGINHVYLRENDWNLWFVVTGPDRGYIESVLHRITQRTGYRVLELRLERAFYIDLGFSLRGAPEEASQHANLYRADHRPYAIEDGDRELVQTLTLGLPLVPQPFEAIASRLQRTEADVIARITALTSAGIVPRLGVIVRHRALGWRSNAMVVWDIPPDRIEETGKMLAATPGINLCYRRTRYAGDWPYNLYCMIHAKSRDEAISILTQASEASGLDDVPRKILFSLRCFKQTGAMVALPEVAA
ncbi:MAG: Lrp/AsnC family transcriptional regulator [Hyphomicrobium sp.]|nr:Lrp/AsnC family transcriptional regulator [Hyphomicrobium sp.]